MAKNKMIQNIAAIGIILICGMDVQAEKVILHNGMPHCFDVEEVLKVVDGDTIDVRLKLLPFSLLNDIRIRMENINAWESRTRDLAEKQKGLAAKERLKELTKDEVTVCLSGQGKYGRWLGTLFSGTTNINQQLIDEGPAHEYDGGKRKSFSE